MAPVVAELGSRPGIDCSVATGQHREMLDEVLELFGIRPDHDLDVMTVGQTPSQAARVLGGIDELLAKADPDWVVVQGDTTTAMAVGSRVRGACASPTWRRACARLRPAAPSRRRSTAAWSAWSPTCTSHRPPRRAVTCSPRASTAPTSSSRGTRWSRVRRRRRPAVRPAGTLGGRAARRRSPGGAHRPPSRELRPAVAGGLRGGACPGRGRRRRAHRHPVHPNPDVQALAAEVLGGVDRVHLVPPLDYRSFVGLLSAAHLVLTDSGGVQEEAPSVGVPVLVLRDVTERPEAVEAGTARHRDRPDRLGGPPAPRRPVRLRRDGAGVEPLR